MHDPKLEMQGEEKAKGGRQRRLKMNGRAGRAEWVRKEPRSRHQRRVAAASAERLPASISLSNANAS